MKDLSRYAGVSSALRNFAVTKHAGFLGDVLSSAKSQAFGQPLEAARQIRSGTLFKPETGLYHQALPRTTRDIAGNLAVPLAMTAMFANMSPEGTRGELVGDAVGNIAGSLLGRPLAGVVGQVGGGMLLSGVGREIGRNFDSLLSRRKSEVAADV